nr:putative aminopeptidase W07G4.4 [Lytechinus pictus]
MDFDAAVGKEVTFIAVPTASPGDSQVVYSPGYSKVVFSPTGPTNRDYDDHRNFADAAGAGIKRAIVAGMRKPLLIVCPSPDYPNAMLAAALGALHAAYVPFEIREDVPSRRNKLSSLTIYSDGASSDLARYIHGIESGRLVARDIGGSDPERMAAPKVAAYMGWSPSIQAAKFFGDKNTYPLFAAVDRCAQQFERHRRIIKLEYEGSGRSQRLSCGQAMP